MRVIRFRGKRLLDNKFVYGSLVQCLDGSVGIFNGDDFEHNKISAVKKSTVGQFTGLTDKNGKEIYEGDIIRHKDMVKPYHVIYDGHQFTPNDGFRSLSYPKHWEVVGNIHDNPELIKKGGQDD